MKQLKYLLIICFASLSPAIFAQELSWLTFQMTDDSALSVASENLVLNYSNGVLQLSSPTVNQSLDITKVKSMQFTSSPSGVTDASCADSDALFVVYSLSGVAAGSFNSIENARENLPSGTYIVKHGENSLKVIF